MTRMHSVAILFAAGLGLAALAPAAVDPELIIIDTKAKALNTQIGVVGDLIAIDLANLNANHTHVVANFKAMSRSRVRAIEGILLACAVKYDECLPLMYTSSSYNPDCLIFEPPPPSNHVDEHDVGYACPLREVALIVKKDIELAQKQALDRDYVNAQLHLEAAIAAGKLQDAPTAFREACAAFKYLACP